MILFLLMACGADSELVDTVLSVSPPEVGADALMVHLEGLSSVQVEGTRALGGAGYDGSVALVVEALEGAGYSPQVQSFEIQSFVQTGPSVLDGACLLYTSPSPRDQRGSRMPSSA